MASPRSLRDCNRSEEARGLLAAAVTQTPRRADLWCQLGTVLMELDDPQEAEQAFQNALALAPGSAEARVGLGNLRLEQGDVDAACALLEAALESDPGSVPARFHLAQARKVRAGDPNLAALEQLAQCEDRLSTDKRVSLHYALGKAYDDLQQWDRAFPHFLKGAQLKRAQLDYDSAADSAILQRIAAAVDGDLIKRLQGAGDPSDVPVFILGMPRSGTTLTEQILASHPEVFGAGELPDLIEIVQQPLAAAAPFPEGLTDLSPQTAAAWGAEYATRLRRRAPGARRITDKMPANYLALGLIPVILPRARIIHVKRNPVDTCLSCFTRLFNQRQDATYDLAELGRHYADYARLMNHWRSVLPSDAFLEVQYEDIVADVEGQARRLIDWVGLEWNDACLAFHQTRRPVRTASMAQVRQPIYGSSVERWRHYEKFLGPLLKELGGLDA